MADIIGTPGDDTLIGTPEADTISGLAGNDVIQGREGDDTLDGGDDHDLINGQQGNDVILGGNGDDLMRPGTGDDNVDGGAGWDRVSFASVGTDAPGVGVTVSLLLQGAAQDTGHGMDVLTNIEHLTGTAFNDVLTGDNGDNWLWGSIDPETGGPGGNDTLSGGAGNDLLEVSAGNHSLDGGTGTDALSFTSSEAAFTGGVTFSLALQGAGQVTGQGTMTASGFENLSGSAYSDTLSGDGNANVLAGHIGNDTIFGGAGDDILLGDGQIGIDSHGLGYSGLIVTLNDVAAAFSLTPGNDTLDGGAGDDILNGGGGTDTASFASWTERVIVGLNNAGNGFATNELGTENDTLISIENVSGSAYNDSINGNNFDNVLTGGAGHDLLFGRGGDDVMIGGDGDDFLRGSDGADVMDGGSGWDRVSSFVAAPTSGITFNLTIQGLAQDTGQGMDVLIGIEHASGTILSDTLIGDGGANWLWGGSAGTGGTGTGNDNIDGGGGDDLIEVGTGNHMLAGGTGTDTLSFLGGHVDITADGVTFSLALQGAAQATEQGSMNASGFENVSGSLLDDMLTGNNGANILLGDLGNDTLAGGDGNDTLYGDGRIHIDSHETGGSGPITLFGDAAAEFGDVGGNDVLIGGKGDDTLYGGQGDDVLTGNQGADDFVFETASGDDRITDFARNQDHVTFSGLAGVDDFGDLTLSASGGHDTLVTWGTTDSILIEGVRPHQLSAAHFTFEASAPAAVVTAAFADESGFGDGTGMGRLATEFDAHIV